MKNKYIIKRPWYLSTPFISIMFCLWLAIIPAIIGIILLFMQYKFDKNYYSNLNNKINDDANLLLEKATTEANIIKNELLEKEKTLAQTIVVTEFKRIETKQKFLKLESQVERLIKQKVT
ncbi:hypothetical protein PV797_06845 [Clostridiaceae bacterium M8S5]|nr:hypothetical protein PV797_06845 [Clostridiaceae bacterium M8S5]